MCGGGRGGGSVSPNHLERTEGSERDEAVLDFTLAWVTRGRESGLCGAEHSTNYSTAEEQASTCNEWLSIAVHSG